MKLLFENWRKYLKEQDTNTVPVKESGELPWLTKKKKQRRKEEFSLPAELLPTLFKVFVGDPETFSLIDLEDLKNKDFEEVRHDKKYTLLLQQMLDEPIKTLIAIGHYGKIKKEHYKDFFDFILKLPEEEKIHVLTALAIYSDKWTHANIIGLLASATEQIELYGCLFHERNPASFKVEPSDYHHCRGDCEEKCKAEKKECLDRDNDSDCAQKEEECEKACKEKKAAAKNIPTIFDL